MTDFIPFPKMPRHSRGAVITEKLDGTNAQVFIRPLEGAVLVNYFDYVFADMVIRAGSRNRWIKPGKTDDNAGFAAWVFANAASLVTLGEGRHFGEWWGKGIQRGYGLTEKRFSLFNVGRFSLPENRPACCDVVPVIATGQFTDALVDGAMETLRVNGSLAAPGFMNPEGIIIFHTAAKQCFKKTFEHDDTGKEAA